MYMGGSMRIFLSMFTIVANKPMQKRSILTTNPNPETEHDINPTNCNHKS